MFAVMFKQVLILAVFAVIGFFLSKTGKLPVSCSRHLSTLVVWVFMPATAFKSFATSFTTEYISQKYDILISAVVATVVIVLLSILIARFLTRDGYRRWVYSYSISVPNSGYMGIPITEAVFGEKMLLSYLMFALPINIYLYSIGYCTLTKIKISLKKLLNPPIIAIVLGMAVGLSGFTIPELATDLLSTASAPLGPCTMLILGMTLSEYQISRLLKNPVNYFVTAIRLIIIPLVFSYLFYLLGLKNVILPALLVYSMPCGLNTVVFPKLVGEDCQTGAALTLISTTLAMITIPLNVSLFT